MQVRSLGQEDPLEEEMETPFSIVWRILWTEEPGGLWSLGLQRVGHDQSDLACIHSWSEYWRVRGVIKLLQNMCPREERNLHLSYILVQSKEPCFLL